MGSFTVRLGSVLKLVNTHMAFVDLLKDRDQLDALFRKSTKTRTTIYHIRDNWLIPMAILLPFAIKCLLDII